LFARNTLSAQLIRQLRRFILVGVVNTALGLAIIFSLIYFLGLGALMANLLGYGVGFLLAFVVNKRWTFESKLSTKAAMFRYFVCTGFAFGLNLIVVMLLDLVTDLGPYLVQLGGIAIYSTTMFLLCRTIVFRPGQT
jgi:putative flippase GtrA